MVVIGQKWLCSGKVVVFWQKWLCSCKSSCNRAKVVVFGQIGSIPVEVVVIRKVVVFGQKWLFLGKVVVFGQSSYIR